jgi:hypothetical protein
MLSAHSLLKKLSLIPFLALSGIAWGESDSSSEPAIFANTIAGATFYKSELVQNNEMVMTYSYSAGVYGGELRKAGIVLDMENGSYNFGFNKSKIDSSTLDASVRYLWSPFFAGVILSNTELAVSAPPDTNADGYLDLGTSPKKYMNVSSRGVGAIVGANIEVNKIASVYTDVSLIETVDVNESYIESGDDGMLAAKKSVKVGRRSKLHIGGLVQITKKNLDFNFGYQYQQVPITAVGVVYEEKKDTLFAGLRFRASF